MSPARCSCISTPIKIEIESTSGRRRFVDQGGIDHDQQLKHIPGVTVYYQRSTSTAISKAKAYMSCISKAIEPETESTFGRHSRVDQGGISTARTVYRQQSKLKREHLWSTQPCWPLRCVDRERQSKNISGASVKKQ